MSSGYQQSRDPRQGPSSSAGEIPNRQEYVSLNDFYWGDFDADFTQPEIRDQDLPVPSLDLRRRGLLRASSLPSSASIGPRMTEREWEEIDRCLEGLYNFPANEERYAQAIVRTDPPVAQSQSSSSIVRSKTVPTVQAAARSRMVLDDDSEEYVPEVRARLRKRDKLKLIGTRLVGKFKKLGRGQNSTGPTA